MSRIGKTPVKVPPGVKVAVEGRTITVAGPLGQLHWEHHADVSLAYDAQAQTVVVARQSEQRQARALHGLTRALVQNMMVGVTQGYQKRLEIVGVGYLAAVQGTMLQLRVGLANELQVPIPEGLTVTCPDQQHVLIKGIDKQQVTQFAAAVRACASPSLTRARGSVSMASRSAASRARPR